MNLKWEYNKIRKDYTAKTELSAFSVWINVSADQILINVDDDDDSFSYGKFVSTADLEKRLREIEVVLSKATTENLVNYCVQLMTAIKDLK